ncbi:urease accessory protein UreD [Hyphomicrobium sp.]|uniref:urease accessory protein UreD n=1 Tax=Hyphomicrobium sp. TaxID=82 RepID=UPI0035634BB6
MRARAEVRGVFERAGRKTRLIDTFETGGLRLRIPNSDDRCEAVVLNTAGGLAGGDEAHLSFALGRKSNVCLTTQSAEKIYRADDKPAVVAAKIDVGDGANLLWMPQETILFNGSGLSRSLHIDMSESASVIAVEITVFGRVARGERLGAGVFRDRWRIRRGGSLVFADDVRLEGEISDIVQKAAVGNGVCAIATLVYLSSKAEKSLQSVRTVLDAKVIDGGASAWNGMLVVRFAAREPLDVRNAVAEVLRRLSRAALPRVWSI